MYKRSVDHWNALKDVLKAFAKIVAVSQARVLGEDDIHLNVQFVAGVICLESLNVFDRLRKAHRQVE